MYIADKNEFYMVIKYVNEHESNVPLGWDGGKRYNFMQNQLAWNVNNNYLKNNFIGEFPSWPMPGSKFVEFKK